MLYKADFPIFSEHAALSYLDNAATSHKPKRVIDAIKNYYETENGSPHRGAHFLSVKSTEVYTEGRMLVKEFIEAQSDKEIIFTRNATESLNLIAYGFVDHRIQAGQNIVLSITNHHSNILPFQRLMKKHDIELRYLYCDDQGKIKEDELSKIDENTFMVSLPLISNGIGTIHDVKKVFEKADQVGAIKVLDAAQGVGHEVVSVKELEPDFMVFSGHKMYGPQGIGVLYGRLDQLEKVEPFITGGDMIEYVTEQSSTYADLPERLEAGTQNVEGVLGLSEAIKHIRMIGLDNIKREEQNLTVYAYEKLKAIDFVDIYGPKSIKDRGALITFNVKEVHPHDVASIMDFNQVAIRAGHHCCQPLMHYMNTKSTCRISMAYYNTKDDVDRFIEALEKVKDVFYE